jgi:hypothetical protein
MGTRGSFPGSKEVEALVTLFNSSAEAKNDGAMPPLSHIYSYRGA